MDISLSAARSRTSTSQPSQPPNTYTVQQGVELSASSLRAELPHMISAADHLSSIFAKANLPFGFIGGFSMYLRGSDHWTVDLDLTVEANMEQILTILREEPRIIRPLGPVSGVLRIFVLTGGNHDTFFLPERGVQVDILLPGCLGAPLQPSTSLTHHTTSTPLGLRTYPILNIQALLHSKLNAFSLREAPKDYFDINYLISKYAEIYEVRGMLDIEQRIRFVGRYKAKMGVGKENSVRRVKYVLGVA